VCAAKASDIKRQSGIDCAPLWAVLLDTKGPEICTAMLRGGKNIQLEKGQEIIVEAVGDRYTEFEGFKDSKETRIGLSYTKICFSLTPGDHILIADGTISIIVQEIVTATTLRGKVLNSKELGERKNCNLPGVKVQLPVLTDKDVRDLKEFACKHHVDYVAASFVQSAEDVQFIRSVLDQAGGFDIKIISKIENQEGLNNFGEILRVTDGVMVARGDLGATLFVTAATPGSQQVQSSPFVEHVFLMHNRELL
jgi:pyruvate kinase